MSNEQTEFNYFRMKETVKIAGKVLAEKWTVWELHPKIAYSSYFKPVEPTAEWNTPQFWLHCYSCDDSSVIKFTKENPRNEDSEVGGTTKVEKTEVVSEKDEQVKSDTSEWSPDAQIVDESQTNVQDDTKETETSQSDWISDAQDGEVAKTELTTAEEYDTVAKIEAKLDELKVEYASRDDKATKLALLEKALKA